MFGNLATGTPQYMMVSNKRICCRVEGSVIRMKSRGVSLTEGSVQYIKSGMSQIEVSFGVCCAHETRGMSLIERSVLHMKPEVCHLLG